MRVWGWELAQLSGLLAVLGCLALCALAVRPRRHAPRPLPLGKHETLGWITLAAALLHVSLLPVFDRRVIEHLRLTTPRYEWAGEIALLLLLLLTVPAAGAIRRRIWSRHRSFQALHVAMACFLIVSLAVHVVATDRYLHGRIRAAIYLGVSGAALLALVRTRPRPLPAQRLGFVNGLVFGRHARLVVGIVAAAIAALLALMAGGAALALREPVIARQQPLPIDFPHDKHHVVACVTCHHNFIDRSGDGGCISCHRSDRVDLRAGAEARFHDFCLGCHRDPPPELERHGPVTRCVSCHAQSHHDLDV